MATGVVDGFLGGTPKRDAPKPAAESDRPREAKAENPFAEVAETARRQAEADKEQKRDRTYWDDRDRARGD